MLTPKHYSKLVLNIPHSSTRFPLDAINEWNCSNLLTQSVNRWTDFYTDKLFSGNTPTPLPIESIIFPYSRFYCDAERLVNDPMEQVGQGILYTKTDNGAQRKLTDKTTKHGIMLYQRHHKIISDAIIKNALIIDCHSFPAHISDYDICIGYNDDNTKPALQTIEFMVYFFEKHHFSVGINTPYSNSICASSSASYSSVMIELNKRIYMHEESLEITDNFYSIQEMITELYYHLLGLNK